MSFFDWEILKDLAAQSLEGDKDAYREFLNSLKKYLQVKVFRILPEDLREDVIQEVLLAIHKSLKTLDLNRDIKPWVNAITHYKINDALRTLYKDKNIENVEADSLVLDKSDLVSEKQYLEHHLKILNQQEKEIVIKLKVEGLSIREVAKQTGKTSQNIKVICFRSLKKLRESMLEEEFL